VVTVWVASRGALRGTVGAIGWRDGVSPPSWSIGRRKSAGYRRGALAPGRMDLSASRGPNVRPRLAHAWILPTRSPMHQRPQQDRGPSSVYPKRKRARDASVTIV